MVKAYYGGIISATPPGVSSSNASGFFSSSQHMQAVKSNLWPTVVQLIPTFAIYASSSYDSQGWVSASTDYTGSTGVFSFYVPPIGSGGPGIQSSSGGARTIFLPYTTTSKIYFEILISSGGGGDTLVGLGGDAIGGYANIPSVYIWNGNGYGGYTNSLGGAVVNGNTINVAYNAITGKVFYGKNGTWSSDPVLGTGATIPNVTPDSIAPRLVLMNGASAGSSLGGTIKTKSGTLLYSTPSGYTTIN